MRRSESIGTYDEVELNRPKNYIYREISIIICARWARDSDPHTDAPGARNCAARNGNRLLLRPGRHGSRGGRHLSPWHEPPRNRGGRVRCLLAGERPRWAPQDPCKQAVYQGPTCLDVRSPSLDRTPRKGSGQIAGELVISRRVRHLRPSRTWSETSTRPSWAQVRHRPHGYPGGLGPRAQRNEGPRVIPGRSGDAAPPRPGASVGWSASERR
jgi:hypothetical protein